MCIIYCEVYQCSEDGKVLCSFDTIHSASNATGIDSVKILDACMYIGSVWAGGYIWCVDYNFHKTFMNYIIPKEENTPPFNPNALWDNKYNEFKQYIADGNTFPNTVNLIFGAWIQSQRHIYKIGEMLQYRIDKLEEIDEWVWTSVGVDTIWERKYNELLDFIKINKYIPRTYHKTLGWWVVRQRHRYKIGKMLQYRIDKLEEIDEWVWKYNHIKMLEFKQYIDNGHSFPNTQHLSFGRWLTYQRSRYKNNNLQKFNIYVLESIDGWEWSNKCNV